MNDKDLETEIEFCSGSEKSFCVCDIYKAELKGRQEARKEMIDELLNNKFIEELIISVNGCVCLIHKERFIQLLKSLEKTEGKE